MRTNNSFSITIYTHTGTYIYIYGLLKKTNVLPKNGIVAASALATAAGRPLATIATIESKNDECGATTSIGATFGEA